MTSEAVRTKRLLLIYRAGGGVVCSKRIPATAELLFR